MKIKTSYIASVMALIAATSCNPQKNEAPALVQSTAVNDKQIEKDVLELLKKEKVALKKDYAYSLKIKKEKERIQKQTIAAIIKEEKAAKLSPKSKKVKASVQKTAKEDKISTKASATTTSIELENSANISTSETKLKKKATAPVNPALVNQGLGTGGSKFRGIMIADVTSNMYEPSSVNHEASSNFTFLGIYRANPKYQIVTLASGTKELTGFRESQFNSVHLGIRRVKFWDIKAFNNLELRLIRPLNDRDLLNKYKVGQARLQSMFIFSPGKGSTLMVMPRLSKHFYEFKQTRTGEVNTDVSASLLSTYTYSFTDKFGLTLTGLYAKSWTFNNVQNADAFMLGQELYYVVKPNLTLGLGHTNSGSIINYEQGEDSLVELFDENSSSIYSSLTYTF